MKRCEKGLPRGFPMTIKAMDCLINHWKGIESKSNAIHGMRELKWRALEDGYGTDIAIAIMKMTDPKRENLMATTQAFEEEFDDEELNDISDSKYTVLLPNEKRQTNSISDHRDTASLSDDNKEAKAFSGIREAVSLWSDRKEVWPRAFFTGNHKPFHITG